MHQAAAIQNRSINTEHFRSRETIAETDCPVEREREREQYLETKQEWVRNNRGVTREVGSAVW
jgi:hypothetical protein